MNNNLFYKELSAYQIYIEIIKRFPKLENETGGSMYDIFGEEWELLNKTARNNAERMFIKNIESKRIKGIIYDYMDDEQKYRTNEYGEILFKKIPSDIYRK